MGFVVSTAARYSTAQGSTTAVARRSAAAARRNAADARDGGSGECPPRRRRDVTEAWVVSWRDGLAIAGRRRRRGAGAVTGRRPDAEARS